MKKLNDSIKLFRVGSSAIISKLTARRHVLPLLTLAVVFVAAAVIPLKFADRNSTIGENYAAKAQLFSDYWNNEDSRCVVEKIAEPNAVQIDFCNKRFGELVERCRVDKAEIGEAKMEGSEYVRLSDNGMTLELCRKWLQYSGDWNNWIDACFDANTGEVFYLYTNGECIYNSSEYSNVAPGSSDAGELARLIAEEMDMVLYHFDELLEPGASSTAIYLCGESPVKLELSIVYYEGRLFDVKIVCIK